MKDSILTNGQLAFLALSNEYCQAIETASELGREEFLQTMLKLLPRIYIAATDLPESITCDEEAYLPSALDEEYYDSARRSMEMIFGEDDTYLEVFEEDMKYSDTPIAANISESLADIFQALYNLTEAAKDSTPENIQLVLQAAKDDFAIYWSQTLCNVLRALNAIRYR